MERLDDFNETLAAQKVGGEVVLMAGHLALIPIRVSPA